MKRIDDTNDCIMLLIFNYDQDFGQHIQLSHVMCLCKCFYLIWDPRLSLFYRMYDLYFDSSGG